MTAMTPNEILAVLDIENYNVIASSSWVFDRRENRVSRETFSRPFKKSTCDKAVPITAYNHYSIEYRLCIKATEDIEDRVILTASQFENIRAAVASLIAERDALVKANEWQPIESAPKDEMILLFGAKRSPMVCGMFHSRDGWVIETPGEWVSMYAPTHWKPLPPPPTNSTDIKGGEGAN